MHSKRCKVFAGLLAAALPLFCFSSQAADAGLQTNIRFNDYSPLSQSSELMRRLFSPLQALRTNAAIEKSAIAVREQSIDLAREEFTVYVPPTEPKNGYALLVFILPWNAAMLPQHWMAELDKHGMIFVTAAKSGNDENILDRREPLALLAAYNVLYRYNVDPDRVYIGGLSGGSRVAMRLALAYPDLFRGALLNAGSDPIGTAQVRLPPADLMRKFQETSHLVYLTGKNDVEPLQRDIRSRDAMANWCMFDIKAITLAWTAHEIVSGPAFNQGLNALETRDTPTPDKLASCRKRYEHELDDRFREVENLTATGKIDAAKKLLDAIDERFGGLAAPRSVEMARRLQR
jgi:Esterase PHB depolymerase